MARSKTLSRVVTEKSLTLSKYYLCKVPSNTQLITYCPFINVLSFVMGETEVMTTFCSSALQRTNFPPVLLTLALDTDTGEPSKQANILLKNEEYCADDDHQNANGYDIDDGAIQRIFLLSRKELAKGLLRAVVYPLGNVFRDGTICWPSNGHNVVESSPFNVAKLMNVFHGSPSTTHEIHSTFYDRLAELDKEAIKKDASAPLVPGYKYVCPLTRKQHELRPKEFHALCKEIKKRVDDLVDACAPLDLPSRRLTRKSVADPELAPLVQLKEFAFFVDALFSQMNTLCDLANDLGLDENTCALFDGWVHDLDEAYNRLLNEDFEVPDTVVAEIEKPLHTLYDEQIRAGNRAASQWYPRNEYDLDEGIVERNFVEGFRRSDQVLESIGSFNPISLMGKTAKTLQTVPIADFLLVVPESDLDRSVLGKNDLASAPADLIVPLRFDSATGLLMPLPDDENVRFKSISLNENDTELEINP